MRRFLNLIGKIILGILIIVLLFVCYCKYIRKDKVIRFGKYAILIVLTKSMEPTIEEDELIIIKQLKEYNLSDIITYIDNEGTLITHRIVQLDEYSFIAKGDNNPVIDNNIPIENIQGKVIFSSKPLGIFILRYLKILIILDAIAILIIFLIRKIMEVKEAKDEEEKK